MSTKVALTPELQQQIVASIRAGGYAHIAAQAWGVSEPLWRRWLTAGRRRDAREPYRTFYRLVQQAKAQARLKAEMDALGKDPRFWLKNGPGKDPGEAPGWAALSKAARPPAPDVPVIALADVMKMSDAMRPLFAADPEKLAALESALPPFAV